MTIGGGNSGTDVAADAARVAIKAGISLRRGYWFVPRMIFGKPTFEFIPHWLPTYFQQLFIRFGFFCKHGRLSDYGLPSPQYALFDHPLSICDQMFQDIRKGRRMFVEIVFLLYILILFVVDIYPDVKSIDGKIVTFVDGTSEEFDLVVFATGYKVTLTIIDHLIEVR